MESKRPGLHTQVPEGPARHRVQLFLLCHSFINLFVLYELGFRKGERGEESKEEEDLGGRDAGSILYRRYL